MHPSSSLKALKTIAREALLRALPHLTPRRRELVLSALMSNPAPNDWYESWISIPKHKTTFELENSAYYVGIYILLKSEPKHYKNWVARLNKAIDDIESRNPGP